jgi:hypothetical protein
MPETDFLLEVFIIALDTPAHLGEIDEAAERHVRGDGCEPVFGGLGFALGPLFGKSFIGPGCKGAGGRLLKPCDDHEVIGENRCANKQLEAFCPFGANWAANNDSLGSSSTVATSRPGRSVYLRQRKAPTFSGNPAGRHSIASVQTAC